MTTSCPFLPGQPVNVLNVPVILPDTQTRRKRDSSVSSQRSDYRTMNPEDKYMNPRTPPKPKLPRLKTSPTIPQGELSSWYSLLSLPLYAVAQRSASQPASAIPTLDYRPSKDPGRKEARSVSPPKSRGIRDAFRNWTPSRSATPHPEESRGRLAGREEENHRYYADDHWLVVPESGYCSSNYSSGLVSRTSSNGHDYPGTLPFRHHDFNANDYGPLPIQDRRAAKLVARDLSPYGTCSAVNTLVENIAHDDSINATTNTRSGGLEDSLCHYSSSLSVSVGSMPAADDETPTPRAYKSSEKRLPTLPNSPSSVMDEALETIDSQNAALDMDALQSHFSDWTSTDGSCAGSFRERSRFSEWSTDEEVETVSPASMTSSSTFNNDSHTSTFDDVSIVPHPDKHCGSASFHGPVTPTLNAIPESTSTAIVDGSPSLGFSSGLPPLIITSDDLRISGLCISTPKDDEYNPKRHAGLFGRLGSMGDILQAPDSASSSCTVFPERSNDAQDDNIEFETNNNNSGSFNDAALSRSSVMQELMDELGYLGDMIQVDAHNVC